MFDYIDRKYRPNKNDLVVEYYLEPNRVKFEKVANAIAGESSIGTWTDVVTMDQRIAERLKPNIFSLSKKRKTIKIAYPVELFEVGNMPCILSSIAGNIFGMKAVKNLRLEDISFPEKIIKSFKGPKFGINGVRKVLRVRKRPLVGTIIKPKVGLNPDKHAKVAYEAWVGGCDIVKDDENLTNQRFNPFRERVVKTLRMRDKAEEETGEKKVYMPNISAETEEMLKRASFVKDNGGRYIMVDIITVGWSGLQSVRDADSNLVIHAHRAGHGALTENPRHGISMLAIAKVARLIGVDQLHIGTVVGKMKGGAEEVIEIDGEIEKKFIHKKESAHVLEQRWFNIKPVFAVCSGGLHPGLVPKLMKIMGNNIICQFGGGIHGHFNGTKAGAMAARQAVSATMNGISLKKYAKTHDELRVALEQWDG